MSAHHRVIFQPSFLVGIHVDFCMRYAFVCGLTGHPGAGVAVVASDEPYLPRTRLNKRTVQDASGALDREPSPGIQRLHPLGGMLFPCFVVHPVVCSNVIIGWSVS